MSIIEEIRNDVEGVALLTDWLGEGGVPVSQHQAETRSKVCISGDNGKRCPLNMAPGWWEKHIKEPIADTILAELELKNRLELHVPDEEALAMCQPCGCCVRLKVWTPIKHIKAHTSPDVFAKFPPWCWQKTEIEGQ